MLAIAVSIINGALLCVMSYRLIHIFQLGGYRVRPLVNWLMDRRVGFYTRLVALTLLGIGSMMVVNVLFDSFTDNIYLSFLGLIFYFSLGVVFCTNMNRKKARVSLRYTARVQRLYVPIAILSGLLTYVFLWLGGQVFGGWIRFSLIAVIPLFLPMILITAGYIIWPVEALVRQFYIRKAKRRLNQPQFTNLVRIGITGSYGKTSCKNILASMIEKKFKTTKSPSSFNTPMGFAKTVNNILADDTEVLIFEMGLRYRRDIKTLAKLFKPMHGILTGIGTQHIETMRTVEAIKAEKSELLRALPDSGIAVLNGESPGCVEIYDELDLKTRILTGVDKDMDFCAQNVRVTPDGCMFDLKLNQEVISCTTKLLGKHNIENILVCATLAFMLGVPSDLIAQAVAGLEATPHRLELIKSANGVLILDDSYNASEQGTQAALDVLSLFEGKKVVQTPGIVEQGSRAHEVNFKYAKRIAKVADIVIVVGEFNRQAILDGLDSAKFNNEHIYVAKGLDEVKELYPKILSGGDVLLIANDLPDNFV